MVTVRSAKESKRKPPKRMLAAGRKIDGVWQVKTFLRNDDARQAFWQTTDKRRVS